MPELLRLLQHWVMVLAEIAAKLTTFLSFVSWYILSSKPLVQDVQHFAAEINKEKRQGPCRHDGIWGVESSLITCSR